MPPRRERSASATNGVAARLARVAGLTLIAAGIAGIAWTIVVWQWQDPFTALYTKWQQHDLRAQYAHIAEQWRARPSEGSSHGARATVAREAADYRRGTRAGEAIGKIIVGRLGLHMILVDGTDETSLEKGPGRDLRTYMPGEDRLVYIAGHRTTYLAPFAHIDDIRRGDYIRLELPYATFVYRAFRHEIVQADAMWMLRSPHHELLRLQACHPRFFATHRYIVDARLVHVSLPDGRGFSVS
jgi:sortase A